MPQRWALRWAIEGDLRFLSHHDMMAATERICHRANVPLRFSQGFNPRPQLSLPAPRPVGVAGLDELLVLRLDESIDPAELTRHLNAQSLTGLRYLCASPLPGSKAPQPTEVHYRQATPEAAADRVRQRLSELGAQDHWPVQRLRKAKRRNAAPRVETFDLRPAVRELSWQGDGVHFVCVPHEDRWAKPAEVLALLGQDDPAWVARLTRRRVVFDNDPPRADNKTKGQTES